MNLKAFSFTNNKYTLKMHSIICNYISTWNYIVYSIYTEDTVHTTMCQNGKLTMQFMTKPITYINIPYTFHSVCLSWTNLHWRLAKLFTSSINIHLNKQHASILCIKVLHLTLQHMCVAKSIFRTHTQGSVNKACIISSFNNRWMSHDGYCYGYTVFIGWVAINWLMR